MSENERRFGSFMFISKPTKDSTEIEFGNESINNVKKEDVLISMWGFEAVDIMLLTLI